MKAEVVRSRANALVKLARAVRDGKSTELILVEGVRLCEEAARSAVEIEHVLFTERLSHDARGAQLLNRMEARARRMVAVSEDVLASVSDTRTPQGIVVLAHRPPTDRSVLDPPAQPHATNAQAYATNAQAQASNATPLVVVMHRANNPSNAGAMMRVAEATGATGVITTQGSTDLFSPKALRGAMGSSFRLPVWSGAEFAEVVAWCGERRIQTVGTDARAGATHTEIDWTVPCAVIVGAEGGGLAPDETQAADVCIRIPMRPPVESLNVSVALAVVLYEAARQRGNI